jgi:hypothetical protein
MTGTRLLFALHSLFLYSDTPLPIPPSFQLVQVILSQTLYPYEYPSNLVPVIFLLKPPVKIAASVVLGLRAGLSLLAKFAGSNPAEAVGFFRAKKSSARLPSEGK